MTVKDGEMAGVGYLLDEVRSLGREERVLRVGVDNVGVLKYLRKGRGVCGVWEQKVREWGLELLNAGWEIEWRWVPGHVGIMENELVDGLAREGAFREEEVENEILSWGCWKERRRERVERVWKEYWKGREKGRAYFGSGKGEKGHGGSRRESMFLFWMRTGHGRMRGTRYGRGEGLCECGEREDRDHVLLKCKLWVEERGVIWNAWKEEGKTGDMVDMRWLLFEEKGIGAVRKFGCETGWVSKRWGERGNWDRNRSEGWEKNWVEGLKGVWKGRTEEAKKVDREKARVRMRVLREKRRGNEGRDVGKSRARASIASAPTLGVCQGGRRKVLGVLLNEVEKRGGRK